MSPCNQLSPDLLSDLNVLGAGNHIIPQTHRQVLNPSALSPSNTHNSVWKFISLNSDRLFQDQSKSHHPCESTPINEFGDLQPFRCCFCPGLGKPRLKDWNLTKSKHLLSYVQLKQQRHMQILYIIYKIYVQLLPISQVKTLCH